MNTSLDWKENNLSAISRSNGFMYEVTQDRVGKSYAILKGDKLTVEIVQEYRNRQECKELCQSYADSISAAVEEARQQGFNEGISRGYRAGATQIG